MRLSFSIHRRVSGLPFDLIHQDEKRLEDHQKPAMRWLPLFAALLLALGLITAQPVFAADLYKWTDERGTAHYTDKPPKGVKAEKITRKLRKFVEVGSDNESSSSSDSAAATSPTDSERCKSEKQRLQVLQSNQRIRMKTEDGTMKDLSTQEIAEEIAFAEKAVEYYCK